MPGGAARSSSEVGSEALRRWSGGGWGVSVNVAGTPKFDMYRGYLGGARSTQFEVAETEFRISVANLHHLTTRRAHHTSRLLL